MTRETKVGLLVGMGVILLIGIIVSDQLSHIQRQDASALTNFGSDSQQSIQPVETSVDASHIEPPTRPRQLAPRPEDVRVPIEAVDAPPMPDRPRAESATTSYARQLAMRLEEERDRLNQEEPIVDRVIHERAVPVDVNLGNGATAPTPPTRIASRPAPAAQLKKHTVVSGDRLYNIAETYLGDGNRWREIAKANPGKVGSDGEIVVGVTLTIPADTTTQNDAVESAPQPATPRTAPQPKTYTVKSGDSLYSIAQSQLGNGGAWKKIYDANRDQLANPDQVKTGQTLRIPS